MTAISATVTRKARRKIDPAKVWGFYDSDPTVTPDQQAICEAYMTAHGIPTSNLISADLSAVGALGSATIWGEWAGDAADTLVANGAEAVFCAPKCQEQACSITNVGAVSFSRFLGYLPVIKSIMAAVDGATELTDLSLNFNLNLLRFENNPTFPGTPLSTKPWSKIITQGAPARGNYFGDKTTNAQDDQLLPDTLEVDGLDIGDFTGYSLNEQVLKTNAYVIDWTLFETSIDGAAWEVLPSWRLGWFSGTAGPNTNTLPPDNVHAIPDFTASDATALAQRSIAARGYWHTWQGIDCVVDVNDRGASSSAVLGAGLACSLDALLRDLGFTVQLGRSTVSNDDLTDTGSYPDSIPQKTGNSRYASGNFDYSYSGGVYSADNTTFPITVGAIYCGSVETNLTVTTDYKRFVTSDPDQVYEITDGCVGWGTPSHGNPRGAWFIQAGGTAHYGHYLEPNADEHANNANTFFLNLLRGHDAASAALMHNGFLLSQEELIGDGLAAPFYYEGTTMDVTIAREVAINNRADPITTAMITADSGTPVNMGVGFMSEVLALEIEANTPYEIAGNVDAAVDFTATDATARRIQAFWFGESTDPYGDSSNDYVIWLKNVEQTTGVAEAWSYGDTLVLYVNGAAYPILNANVSGAVARGSGNGDYSTQYYIRDSVTPAPLAIVATDEIYFEINATAAYGTTESGGGFDVLDNLNSDAGFAAIFGD